MPQTHPNSTSKVFKRSWFIHFPFVSFSAWLAPNLYVNHCLNSWTRNFSLIIWTTTCSTMNQLLKFPNHLHLLKSDATSKSGCTQKSTSPDDRSSQPRQFPHSRPVAHYKLQGKKASESKHSSDRWSLCHTNAPRQPSDRSPASNTSEWTAAHLKNTLRQQNIHFHNSEESKTFQNCSTSLGKPHLLFPERPEPFRVPSAALKPTPMTSWHITSIPKKLICPYQPFHRVRVPNFTINWSTCIPSSQNPFFFPCLNQGNSRPRVILLHFRRSVLPALRLILCIVLPSHNMHPHHPSTSHRSPK